VESKKIALIGTSCVGKTTLLEELKRIYPQYVFINEVARDYFSNNKSKNRFSFKDQQNIQDLVMDREKEMKGNIVVCDRSVICPIIYTNADGDILGGKNLHSRVKEWIPTYSQLLLLDPVDVPYQKDSIRSEEKFFRMKVHKEYVAFLKDNNIQYTLIKGSWDQRLSQIKEIIQFI